MEPITSSDILSIGAPLVSLAGALLLPLLGAWIRPDRQGPLARFGTLGVTIASATVLSGLALGKLTGFSGFIAVDSLGWWACASMLLLTAACVPLVYADPFAFKDHPTLIAGLWLSSLTGALLMATSDHLLMVFLALELLSIPLYVLTCMGRGEKRASEAAFKYFLLGAIASALFVFGMALVWGETGTLRLSELSRAMFASTPSDLSLLGIGMLATALLFKLGVAPFHSWAPDVYEAAPPPLVAWMSGAVKVAAVTVWVRWSLESAQGALQQRLSFLLLALAVVSMLWGSLGALWQTSVRRLLAYSSVAHAGYLLLGIAAAFGGQGGVSLTMPLSFYLLTYALASVAAFTVAFLQERDGFVSIEDYRGLFQRSPTQGAVLAVALLSLAGLPPLSGFFAKFRIFSIVLDQGHLVAVLLASLATLLSLGYYLKLIYQLMMEPSPSGAPEHRKGSAALVVAVACSALVVLLGVAPYGTFSLVTSFWK